MKIKTPETKAQALMWADVFKTMADHLPESVGLMTLGAPPSEQVVEIDNAELERLRQNARDLVDDAPVTKAVINKVIENTSTSESDAEGEMAPLAQERQMKYTPPTIVPTASTPEQAVELYGEESRAALFMRSIMKKALPEVHTIPTQPETPELDAEEPSEYVNDPECAAPPSSPNRTQIPVDSNGCPWDAEIHSSGRTISKKTGRWNKKRGVDPKRLEEKEAQLIAELNGGGVSMPCLGCGEVLKHLGPDKTKTVIITCVCGKRYITKDARWYLVPDEDADLDQHALWERVKNASQFELDVYTGGEITETASEVWTPISGSPPAPKTATTDSPDGYAPDEVITNCPNCGAFFGPIEPDTLAINCKCGYSAKLRNGVIITDIKVPPAPPTPPVVTPPVPPAPPAPQTTEMRASDVKTYKDLVQFAKLKGFATPWGYKQVAEAHELDSFAMAVNNIELIPSMAVYMDTHTCNTQ